MTSNTLLPCTYCDSPFPCGPESPLDVNGTKRRYSYVSGSGKDYDRDGFSDQWLDIYIPNQTPPNNGYPVVVFAHAAGQSADDPCKNADRLNTHGVVFISWESIRETAQLSDGVLPSASQYYASADSDFQAVLLWLRDQSEELTNTNLNLNKVFVSGVSRGTRISFHDLSLIKHLNTGLPLVKGAVFSQAFPDPEWRAAEDNNLANPNDLIQPDYPPILMFYETIPGEIADIHDPIRGLDVLEHLHCAGIPAALFHSTTEGIFSNTYFPVINDFILNPEEMISNLSSNVIQGNLTSSAIILPPPADVALTIHPNDSQRFKLNWRENEWSTLEADPDRLACRIRLSPHSLGEFCDVLELSKVYIQSASNTAGIPNPFSYPPAYVSACELPAVLNTGETYDVQVKCTFIMLGYDQYSADTPWSEVTTITIPECTEVNYKGLKETDYIISKLRFNVYELSSTNPDNSNYQLLDMMGRTIKSGGLREGIMFDLNQEMTGMYILQVWNEAQEHVQFQLMKE